MQPDPEQYWFGERRVDAAAKTELVRGVFDSVASRYDLMNDLMSGGLHRLWKNRFISTIRPRPGLDYLDVAGGTGDIAFRLRKAVGTGARITILDLDEAMLNVGRGRAADRGWVKDFTWLNGNAESLPFPDESFDVYTIAFGLRNVARIDTALKEAARVLRPGGRFYCLEFSHVDEPALGRAYDAYSYKIIPKIGKAVANDRESYQYLIESIRKFPKRKILASRMEAAGLAHARFTSLSFGIAAIHSAWKV